LDVSTAKLAHGIKKDKNKNETEKVLRKKNGFN
jgi:hypothetical protein